MQINNSFDKGMLKLGKLILRFMIILLVISLLLASGYLVKEIIEKATEPPFLLLDFKIVYEIFSMVLVIAVGYELIKSFTIIVSSDKLPTALIIEVAIIAICNKIITLNFKEISYAYLLSISALLLALGIAFYLVKMKKELADEDEEMRSK
jgi:uncharacterized membrane protein (DUF373 family)